MELKVDRLESRTVSFMLQSPKRPAKYDLKKRTPTLWSGWS
jgi:hypothetical protein